MSLHEVYTNVTSKKLFPSRAELLNDLDRHRTCDLLVVGGGVHGATLAHYAAFNGLRVILLEKGDYANSCLFQDFLIGSGHSTNPFSLCKDMQAASCLANTASHLIKPIVLSFEGQPNLSLRISSFLAKRIVKNISSTRDMVKGKMQLLDYSIPSARYVLDRIYTARQEGARCLNYAQVTTLSTKNGVDVTWTDKLSGRKFVSSCGIIANCAGADAVNVGRVSSVLPLDTQMIRGRYYIFKTPSEIPSGLYFDDEYRYIGVNNLVDALIIGPFETQVKNKFDNVNEHEIYNWLALHLPSEPLAEQKFEVYTKYYLKPTDTNKGYRWDYSQSVFTLIGGNILNSLDCAEECLQEINQLTGSKLKLTSLRSRILAGSAYYEERVKKFQKMAKQYNVPNKIVSACIQRWGARVAAVFSEQDDFTVLDDTTLKGEVEYAVNVEQSVFPEDLERRLNKN